MADYSFSPQFANLANLQPLPALDVTRGGGLQFQPLQAIQVQSSRPEIVAESIAGAATNIAKGALGGITARWEKGEEEKKDKRKFAQELILATIKESDKETPEEKKKRALDEYKAKLDYLRQNPPEPIKKPQYDIYGQPISKTDQDQANERIAAVVPSGAIVGIEEVLPEYDNVTTDSDNSLFSQNQDFESTDPALFDQNGQPIADRITAKYTPEVVPSMEVEGKQIAKSVSQQVPEVLARPPAQLGVSTGAMSVPEQPSDELPPLSILGPESVLTEKQRKELEAQKEALYGLKVSAEDAQDTSIKSEEKPVEEKSQLKVGGVYIPKNIQEDEAILAAAANLPKYTKLDVKDEGTPSRRVYRVVPLNPDEVAEKKLKEEEVQSKILARRQYENLKQERLNQQYISAAQKEPSVDALENTTKGVARFASEIPEFYQQYKDYLSQAEAAKIKGDKKSETYNRRMVAETVNAIIDSFARLASGKAVTEGQINMIKKESIDPLQQFTRSIDSWLKGGVVAPDEQVRSIARIAATIGNEAAEKANFFVLGQREKFKEQGVPEKYLPKFYPQDIGTSDEAKKTLSTLTDDFEIKSEEYDRVKDSSDPKDQYKADILKKQLELIDYRIESLKDRIILNEKLAKKGKGKQFLGHKEFVDRPTGLRDLYGISQFQQLMQNLNQPVSE